MAAIKEYLVAVIAAAAVCSVITHIVGSKGAIASITKMIAGLFMATVLLRPVLRLQISEFIFFIEDVSMEGDQIAGEGKRMAEEQMEQIIITQTQAYILDKATTLEVDISVEVFLENNVPAKVRLTGAVSPYAKQQLTAYIESTLGIPTEAQEWT